MIIAQVGSFPLDIKNINGGIESSVFGLVESLIKMDHMVYVFDTPRKDIVSNVIERINDAIIYRYCAGKNKNNYEIASQCEQIIIDIQRIKPDVCHIHGTGYLQKKLFKILAKKGIKCIVTIHGLQNIEKKNELLQKKSLKSLLKYIFLSKSEFYIINNSKKIIVDTEYVKDEIFKYKKKKQIKYLPEIYVIPQGVNSIFYDIDNISKENNILCVGAISKRKGQLLLIQSFVLVKEIVKDAKLIIAGYISDDEYYNQLKQVIRDCNFEDDVKVQLKILLKNYHHFINLLNYSYCIQRKNLKVLFCVKLWHQVFQLYQQMLVVYRML